MDNLLLSINGKEFHTGYSRLSKFMSCPRQYEYVYVKNNRPMSTEPMRRGNAYHGALEAALLLKLNKSKHMPLAKLLEWATYHTQVQELGDSVAQDVRNAVTYWHGTYYDHIDPVFVEKTVKFVRNGVTITCRIDVGAKVYPGKVGSPKKGKPKGVVIDHKSSYDFWTDDRARESTQPIIYQWAWEDALAEEFKLPYGHFEYHIVRTFPLTSAQTLKIYRANQEQSDWFEVNVRAIAELMCGGTFFARPSTSECGRCDFRKECKPCLYRVGSTLHGAVPVDDVALINATFSG